MADQNLDHFIVPYPPRTREIEDKGICAWVSRYPCIDNSASAFTSNWQHCLGVITISEVQGPARNLYLKWTVENVDLVKKLFRDLLPNESWQAIGQLDFQPTKFKPVFVKIVNEGPLGNYMELISSRGGRAKGLFVQLYGTRNLNPCECCENRYLKSIRRFPQHRTETEVHVMWPFFECVSVPGFNYGVCGNCMYHLEEKDCSYNTQGRGIGTYPGIRMMAARKRSFPELGPRRLRPETCQTTKVIRWEGIATRVKEKQDNYIEKQQADQKKKAERMGKS